MAGTLVPARAQDFGQSQPFLALNAGGAACDSPADDLESYADFDALDGLHGGTACWTEAYVDKPGPTGIYALDDFESYADGAELYGLANGYGWRGSGWNYPFVDRLGPYGVYSSDSLESYTAGATVDGLNGGTGYIHGTNNPDIFGGAYVDR